MAQTAEQIAASWQRGLAGASEKIKAGVMSVTEAPTQAAIRELPRAAQNYQEAVSSGRMADALGRVTLQQWQQSVITKGLSRIASGAQQAQQKFANFMGRWLPVANAIKQEVKGMPKGGLANAQARMAVAYRLSKQFANKPTD